MKKFKYIAPKSQVIEVELSSIMATSTEAIKKFTEDDYTEENVKNFLGNTFGQRHLGRLTQYAFPNRYSV